MIKRDSKRYYEIIQSAKNYIRQRAIKYPDDTKTYGIKINLKTGDYTLKPIHNGKEFLQSVGGPQTKFDYNMIAQSAQRAIDNSEKSTLKKVVRLINCSLFANENGVSRAFKALSKIKCPKSNPMIKIITKELLRLNIWDMISRGQEVLKNECGYHRYLMNIYTDSTCSFKKDGNYLPSSLRAEIKSVLDKRFSEKLATHDVVQYLSKYHFLIAHRTLLLMYLKSIYRHLKPISIQLVKYIKSNDNALLIADLEIAENYVSKIVRTRSIKFSKGFSGFIHKLIVDIPSRYITVETPEQVLKSLGRFDLFLMKLYPAVIVSRRNPVYMRQCLDDLVNKNRYFNEVGVRLSLSKSVNDMTDNQVINALHKFIDFMNANEEFVLGKIVKHKVL